MAWNLCSVNRKCDCSFHSISSLFFHSSHFFRRICHIMLLKPWQIQDTKHKSIIDFPTICTYRSEVVCFKMNRIFLSHLPYVVKHYLPSFMHRTGRLFAKKKKRTYTWKEKEKCVCIFLAFATVERSMTCGMGERERAKCGRYVRDKKLKIDRLYFMECWTTWIARQSFQIDGSNGVFWGGGVAIRSNFVYISRSLCVCLSIFATCGLN